tara:strand:+ start:12718 stop:15378 length:2661 start_codon:yes stop_codon:yes gene_type:complete
MMKHLLGALVGLVLASAPALAQSSPLAGRYDAQIPTAQSVLGHEFGAEITPPEQAIAYLRALEAAAPDRIRVVDYATSWEGRPLAYAIIASPQSLERLDAIQADLQQLADPRGLSADARDRLVASTPAVVWLSYGVHGDEISSTDAGLRTAYHLLASRNDTGIDQILDQTIIIIDPVQNPDGRARFVHSFAAARGLQPDENRFTAEHDQPWPGGRTNHYLFDMNRDWFAMTQPETRGRVAAMLEWRPLVVVDAHEMGGDSSYFFAPSAEPFNPHVVQSQRDAQDLIGRNHGRWFDQFGYDYFTREVFDAFYPGYGDMWPTLQGAVAMTYEQASARGLVWRRRDGSLLTYGEAVEHHYVASLSTVEVVAANRERFVRDYLNFRASAASDESGPQSVLLDLSTNRWGAERLARSLVAQGIEVGRVAGPVSACGARFEDGAFEVSFNQPAGRLARTLLEDTTELPGDFMQEQESRRARGLSAELYDVTAWSLPLMHNVNSVVCRRDPGLSRQPVAADDAIASTGSSAAAAWGYAIAWEDAGQARLVAALAAAGVPARSSDVAFTIGERTFPRGSVVVPRHGAPANLDRLIARLGSEIGARFVGLASSWVDEGPNPGSEHFLPVRAPRIAMLWDNGTDSNSAGATRYVLEQRYGMPVSIIRAGTLARADLSVFDVLILPEQGRSGYASVLGSSGSDQLTRFVRAGGVLVGLGDATRWLADPEVGLIPARRERAAETPRASAQDQAVVDAVVLASADELDAVQAEQGAMPDYSPGALLRVEANPDAWMSAGYSRGAAALVTGSDIYAPVSRDAADTAMRFAGPETLLAGGYMWAESASQIAFKPFVISNSMGAGQVIAFTQAPTTRAYLEGLDLLLLNAVLLGPAHSRGMR